MPIDDVAAAHLWRHRHLDRRRMKPAPGPSAAALVARVHALRDLAGHARTAGALDLMLPAIREALRNVPEAHRSAVRMQPWLWTQLLGTPTLALLAAGPELGTLSTEHAAEVGATLAQLAAGELIAR